MEGRSASRASKMLVATVHVLQVTGQLRPAFGSVPRLAIHVNHPSLLLLGAHLCARTVIFRESRTGGIGFRQHRLMFPTNSPDQSAMLLCRPETVTLSHADWSMQAACIQNIIHFVQFEPVKPPSWFPGFLRVTNMTIVSYVCHDPRLRRVHAMLCPFQSCRGIVLDRLKALLGTCNAVLSVRPSDFVRAEPGFSNEKTI